MVKVAAVIRVAVGRGIVPVEVREAVIGAVVPVATETDSTNSVGIDEVRVASSVPLVADVVMQFPGEVPSQRLTPLIRPPRSCMKQRSPPEDALLEDGEEFPRKNEKPSLAP